MNLCTGITGQDGGGSDNKSGRLALNPVSLRIVPHLDFRRVAFAFPLHDTSKHNLSSLSCTAMEPTINPYFTQPDIVVLENLIQDVRGEIRGQNGTKGEKPAPEQIESNAGDKIGECDHDKQSIATLQAYNDPASERFAPTILTTWDDKDIPPFINEYICKPYARIAMRTVRHPTDVVFLTHIIQYLTINLGSAIWLYYNFSYMHGVIHTAYTAWCIGSFTLLMHNHIHNNGVLAKKWVWLDMTFPYILEPLMGHTWDSYYYHHVKHHHVESNGMAKQHAEVLHTYKFANLQLLQAQKISQQRSDTSATTSSTSYTITFASCSSYGRSYHSTSSRKARQISQCAHSFQRHQVTHYSIT